MSSPKRALLDRCFWCNGRNRQASDWEQENYAKGWQRLCKPCARVRLNNPWNALLNMRKVEVKLCTGCASGAAKGAQGGAGTSRGKPRGGWAKLCFECWRARKNNPNSRAVMREIGGAATVP